MQNRQSSTYNLSNNKSITFISPVSQNTILDDVKMINVALQFRVTDKMILNEVYERKSQIVHAHAHAHKLLMPSHHSHIPFLICSIAEKDVVAFAKITALIETKFHNKIFSLNLENANKVVGKDLRYPVAIITSAELQNLYQEFKKLCNHYGISYSGYSHFTPYINLTTPLKAGELDEDMVVNRCDNVKLTGTHLGSNIVFNYKNEQDDFVELNSAEFKELSNLIKPCSQIKKKPFTDHTHFLFKQPYNLSHKNKDSLQPQTTSLSYKK